MVFPEELTPIEDTCALSIEGASCSLSGQKATLTNVGNFDSLTLTVDTNTAYFEESSSSFGIKLTYDDSLIAQNNQLSLSRYCEVPCKECTQTKTECLSCLTTPYTNNDTYFGSEKQCLAECPSTYFELDANCEACDESACY